MTGPPIDAELTSPYRHTLTRWWDDRSGPFALWVLLNPSTATEDQDDPTVKLVVARTRLLYPELAGLMIVNLFGWVDSKPARLGKLDYEQAVGNPLNDSTIGELSAAAAATIVGWGNATGVSRQWLRRREQEVALLLREPHSLGSLTKQGRPRHPKPQNPKQLPLQTRPVPWRSS
jgi:hypothetical protein